MTPRKLNVMFAVPSYGGNGGISSEVPNVRQWMQKAWKWLENDPRVGDITECTKSDTPITMVRNWFVLEARRRKADVLIGVDSDMWPDYLLEPGQATMFDEPKPFISSSFDFLYAQYDKGPVCVAAPYCGPPPHECVYVFEFCNFESDSPNDHWKLEMVRREDAAKRKGIQTAAALPTGLYICDMRCFEYTDPAKQLQQMLDQGMPLVEAQQMVKSWFYYEWKDAFAAEKGSTEDVAFSRDISLHCMLHGLPNPIYCNWDAWAVHWKPKAVGKPRPLSSDNIGAKYRAAALALDRIDEKLIVVGDQNDQPSLEEQEYLKQRYGLSGKFAESGHLKQSTNGHAVRENPSHDESAETETSELKAIRLLHEVRARAEELTPEHRRTVCLRILEAMRALRGQPDATNMRPHEEEALAQVLAGCERVVEVGTWIGETAVQLCKRFPNMTVYTVDTWEGSVDDKNDVTGFVAQGLGHDFMYHLYEENVGALLNDRIIPVHGDSLSVAASWNRGEVDAVFLDDTHTYEHVKAEIQAWLPHIRPGGIICGHDYGHSGFPGVKQAVDEIGADGVIVTIWYKLVTHAHFASLSDQEPPPGIKDYWTNRMTPEGVLTETAGSP